MGAFSCRVVDDQAIFNAARRTRLQPGRWNRSTATANPDRSAA